MKKIILLSLSLITAVSFAANTGLIFDVTANKPNLTIRPNVNFFYPSAGIQITSPGFMLQNQGQDCALSASGFCLFAASPAQPKTLTVTGTGQLTYKLCTNGDAPLNCQNYAADFSVFLGKVKCWGLNSSGELGLGDTNNRGNEPGEMGDNLPTVDLGTARLAKQITTGGDYTCAILDNDSLKCWGRNNRGQLGLGDTIDRGDGPGEMGDNLPAVDLGTGRTVKQVSAGEQEGAHTCAVLDNDSVKCWGYNNQGQLGLGDTISRGDGPGEMGDNLPAVNLGTGRTAKLVVASGFSFFTGGYSCAILDNDSVKCWGNNSFGQLGLGDTISRGDEPGEMGDNLPAVDLGTGRTAKQLTAGGGFNCTLLDNDTVKCWGRNTSGQLGLGDTTNRGDGAGEMGDNLPAVNLGTGKTAIKLRAGDAHACAILNDNSLKCWGLNDSGQLGLGDTINRGDGPGEMGDNLPTVNLGTGRTAKDIYLGDRHTCALLDNDTVKCWGRNTSGQLGLGDTTNRGDGAGEMGDNLPTVNFGSSFVVKKFAIDGGDDASYTCVLLENN
ncbi:RCC1 domain-containing protein [Legionella yabuuchiae]|uniref:RCC1 domain-containing protein n=1 Tax=Legionella yabuuchiae TaxID=376727 RepID=UPI001056704E|nr:hypothetical protein [Legionella yabuuchiae]